MAAIWLLLRPGYMAAGLRSSVKMMSPMAGMAPLPAAGAEICAVYAVSLQTLLLSHGHSELVGPYT